MDQTLPGIRMAEEILLLAWKTEDEDVKEALKKLSIAGATYGTLWGAGNPRQSGMDLDLYELKEKVLRFVGELRADKRFPLVTAIHIAKAQEAEG